MAKAPKTYRLVPEPDLPPAAQAASISLGLCKYAKVDTFADLEEKVQAGDEKVLAALRSVRLSPDQLALIESNMYAVRAVGASPMRTVVVCAACGSVLVVSGGSSPKKCTLTRGCDGQAFRASAAPRRELPAAEAETAS